MRRRGAGIIASSLVLTGLLIALPNVAAAPGGPGTGGVSNRILVTVHPFDWKTTYGVTSPAILNGLDVSLLSVATAGEAGAGAAPTS